MEFSSGSGQTSSMAPRVDVVSPSAVVIPGSFSTGQKTKSGIFGVYLLRELKLDLLTHNSVFRAS
jgi:hypothetical protein